MPVARAAKKCPASCTMMKRAIATTINNPPVTGPPGSAALTSITAHRGYREAIRPSATFRAAASASFTTSTELTGSASETSSTPAITLVMSV